MEGIRNQLEEQKPLQDRVAKLRDELYELQPFTFLSEARYRELNPGGAGLQSRYGEKAFHDILHRLDLMPLAEDLWQEVRTNPQQAKTEESQHR